MWLGKQFYECGQINNQLTTIPKIRRQKPYFPKNQKKYLLSHQNFVQHNLERCGKFIIIKAVLLTFVESSFLSFLGAGEKIISN